MRAFGGSACNELTTPTTVIKQEFVAAERLYTLGAITLNTTVEGDRHWRADMPHYVGGVVQNHQIGAFLGGRNMGTNGKRDSRILFGDSGSVNCSNPAFQRHTFTGIPDPGLQFLHDTGHIFYPR